MNLPLDCWNIIASYLPFGNWKAFILTNKTTFSLNTEEELNKRVNPLWSFINKHPKAFISKSVLRDIANNHWTTPSLFINHLNKFGLNSVYKIYLYRNPYITYDMVQDISKTFSSDDFDFVKIDPDIFLQYITDINTIDITFYNSYRSRSYIKKNPHYNKVNNNGYVDYLEINPNFKYNTSNICFSNPFYFYIFDGDYRSDGDSKKYFQIISKDKRLINPRFTIEDIEINSQKLIKNVCINYNFNLTLDFIKTNKYIFIPEHYTCNVIFDIKTIEENQSLFNINYIYGNPNIKWSHIKDVPHKKLTCKLISKNTFNTDWKHNFYYNSIYNV